MFLALNPSTADETQDDPTVRRMIRFSKSWGFGRLVVCNIFAFRATDPNVMKAQADPIGPDNDAWIVRCARDAGVVVAAWGLHGTHVQRDANVTKTLRDAGVRLTCLGRTNDGHPRHPLYVAGKTELTTYE